MRRKSQNISCSKEPLGFLDFMRFVESDDVLNNRYWNYYSGAEVCFHQPVTSLNMEEVQVRNYQEAFPTFYPATFSKAVWQKTADDFYHHVRTIPSLLPANVVIELFEQGKVYRNDFELRNRIPDTWCPKYSVTIPLLGTIYEVRMIWYEHAEKTLSLLGKFCLALSRNWNGVGQPYWTVKALAIAPWCMNGHDSLIITKK